MNPGELETLLHLMESVQSKVVVEIGVNSGRNPMAAFRNVSTITHYVGIDVPPGTHLPLKAQAKEVPDYPGHLAAGDSRLEVIVSERGSMDLEPEDLPVCDLCFIDGDHSRDAVLSDYALAKQIVRPGGLIVFHDDNGRTVVDVTATLNELCDRGSEIVHVRNTWLSFERVEHGGNNPV